jgi:hypothetical protein
MMEFGMPSIAGVLMALLVHKGLQEQQGLPDCKEHKGLQGLTERLEHRDQQDRKDLPDLPDQRDQQELLGQLAQQGHKVLRGQVVDSTAGI